VIRIYKPPLLGEKEDEKKKNKKTKKERRETRERQAILGREREAEKKKTYRGIRENRGEEGEGD
jgi:hypothetical protein